MSAPTRFLAIAVFSWIGLRATAGAFDLAPLAELKPGPMPAPTGGMSQPAAYAEGPQYSWAGGTALPPTAPATPAASPYALMAAPPRPIYYPYPVYPAPAPMPAAYRAEQAWVEQPAGLAFGALPPAEEAPLSRLATAEPKASGPVPSFTGPQRAGLDRVSLTSWALLRPPPALAPESGAEPGLATGGMLGGSQAGARFTWRFNRALALNARVSAPIDYQQRKIAGEAALGVSWQPLASVPVRLLAERRHPIGAPGGGSKAFALLAEGGVYERPLPWRFRLDGYAQSGVVGVRGPQWFVDGGATVTRPVFGRFAVGGGAWGGAQAGLSRLDVGPRLSMQLRPGVRTHLDYRYRLFGNAAPGNGFAATVATDF